MARGRKPGGKNKSKPLDEAEKLSEFELERTGSPSPPQPATMDTTGSGDNTPTEMNLDEPSVKKKKMAPRSSEQFKIGPKFEGTDNIRSIFIASSDELVQPNIDARIDRGFDLIDNEWIGYKRNYFSLVAAFQFIDKPREIFLKEKFYVLGTENEKLNLTCFAIRLESDCCEEDVKVGLVQHTAKRDRGPQYKPQVFPAVSGTLPNHSDIKKCSNIRNNIKIDEFNRLFYLYDYEDEVSDDSIINTYPKNSKISTVAKYERMQFSNSFNFRRPALVNRHFVLRIELLGILDDGTYIVLSTNSTPPLIVRGRSPSNYKIARMNSKREQKLLNHNSDLLTRPGNLSSHKFKFKKSNGSLSMMRPITTLNLSGNTPMIYQDSQDESEHEIQPSNKFGLNPMEENTPNISKTFDYYDNINLPDSLESPFNENYFEDYSDKENNPIKIEHESDGFILNPSSHKSKHLHKSKSKHKHKHKHKHSHKHRHKHKQKSEKDESRKTPSSFNKFKSELERLQMEL